MSDKIKLRMLTGGTQLKVVGWVMACLMCFVALPAAAYIGPGAGVSFLGSLLSTLAVVLLAIGAILFWPLRYLWRRMRRQKNAAQEASAATQDDN